MAKTEWFETVAEAQRRAEKRLPPSVYSALVAGSERGLTIDDNLAAFGELGFAPHVAALSAKRDLATTVMGQAISMPVLISPTGVQAVHPDGEVAADETVHLVDRLSQIGGCVQRGAGVREGRLARLGEPGDPAGAVEQCGAQLVFQSPDLRADPGLADVHPLGRAGEVRLFGHRHEILELPQLHNR